MDAKEYLLKINKICSDFENGNCGEECPLKKFHCGIPKNNFKIDEAIETVEKYEKTYPFGRCSSCEKEFNSELRNEYGITNCPWCGEKIRD